MLVPLFQAHMSPSCPFSVVPRSLKKAKPHMRFGTYKLSAYKSQVYMQTMDNERLLNQAIRNSLKGTARNMLVSLGEDASVKNILAKLDGF